MLFRGVRFRKCVLPKGLAQEPMEMFKIPKCLDLIGYPMVLTIPTYNVYAKGTTDAFNVSPTRFEHFSVNILGK